MWVCCMDEVWENKETILSVFLVMDGFFQVGGQGCRGGEKSGECISVQVDELLNCALTFSIKFVTNSNEYK